MPPFPAIVVSPRPAQRSEKRVFISPMPPAKSWHIAAGFMRTLVVIGHQYSRRGQVIWSRYPPTPTGTVGPRLQLYRGPSGTMPILPVGMPAYTTDTNQVFIGDGTANHFIGGASAVPASSTSPGKKGQYAGDANYFYYCYADNNWRRVAVSTF